jgi:perosamine synthetase
VIHIAQPQVGQEEKEAVCAVLESGMLAQGPRVAEFEERFAAYCGVQYAVATSSGTTALHVALLAHGLGPGDEVITSTPSRSSRPLPNGRARSCRFIYLACLATWML